MSVSLISDDENKQEHRTALRFEDCKVVDELQIPVTLVRINVDEDEMQRRIQSFIDLKRDEINKSNLRDFIVPADSESCARTASNVYRLKDSKGHLRVKRMKNVEVPMDQAEAEPQPQPEASSSINERLETVETFLKLEATSIPKDVYQRLKFLEDQVAYLKTVSPEYSHFIKGKDPSPKIKHIYTVSEIDEMIAEMESKT